MFRICLVLFVLTLITSCSKEKITKSYVDSSFEFDYSLNQIHFIDEENGFILGGTYWEKGIILNTKDGGLTWTQDSFSNKTLLSLSQDNNGNLYTTGPEGHIHKWLGNNGQLENWTTINLAAYEVLTDASFYDNRGIVTHGVAYDSGKLYFLEDQVEVRRINDIPTDLQAIHMSSRDECQIMGYGLILHSANFGLTFDTINITGDFYKDMSFITNQIGYGLGQRGSILKTSDAGKSWSTLRGPYKLKDNYYTAIYFIDEQTGFTCGEGGLVEKTIDGGQTWSVIFGLPQYDFKNMVLKNNDLYVIGEQGHFIKIKNI